MTGAGGFIGGHMVRNLLDSGHSVTGVDIKPLHEWWQRFDIHNIVADLRDPAAGRELSRNIDVIYHFAADMGGISYISENDWDCASSVAMTVNLLRAATERDVRSFVYASSACVYPATLQGSDPSPLREELAHPGDPEGGYGWEKLFSERLCRYAARAGGPGVRIARLFNVYGPHGTWRGGREKAPAAICRKVAEVALGKSDQVVVWGTGTQLRSFLYIDDCVRGLAALARAGDARPTNLASDELVTVAELTALTAAVAGVEVSLRYDPAQPTGVRARIPDISCAAQRLDWHPAFSLLEGIRLTYRWICGQLGGERAPRTHDRFSQGETEKIT
ncbi:NAD-dependent epimerase/dehydratase family protein [Nonomuraea sp. NPDC050404]|uniref:NAD-dependent epimerase/dehydratase family protein n=1 Tax=Nonomuraea sp. NPDC050404 TaxID=3155783 RepID=UPI0033CFA430